MSFELPGGFTAHIANVGIRDTTDDFVVVASERPCTSAAVFTRSRFAGPSLSHAPRGRREGGGGSRRRQTPSPARRRRWVGEGRGEGVFFVGSLAPAVMDNAKAESAR